MKLKKYLIYPFLCLFLAGCYYCPGAWSDSPQAFTFTLDKYEAKVGDEIKINTGNVKVFDEDFDLYCGGDYYIEKNDELVKVEIFYIKDVQKIDSTNAVFKVPADLPDGNLQIKASFTQKDDDCSCEDGTWYGTGHVDKNLTIVK